MGKSSAPYFSRLDVGKGRQAALIEFSLTQTTPKVTNAPRGIEDWGLPANSASTLYQNGARVARREASVCLVADGDGLQLEMAAAQQRGRSDEFARGQVLGSEVGAVDSVEFVEEREVRAGNLHVDQIVHGHTGLLESGLDLIEQDLDFVVDFGGDLARLIQADPPCQVQRIAGQDAAAERRLRIIFGEADGPAAGLRGRLGKRAAHGKQSRGGKHQE
jgi:hypothetical protein